MTDRISFDTFTETHSEGQQDGTLRAVRLIPMPETDSEPTSASVAPITSAATVSLIFGLLSLCFTPPFLSAIIAIGAGYIARRVIRQSNGQFGGMRQARMGMVMGGISLSLTVLAGFVWFVWFLIKLVSTNGA